MGIFTTALSKNDKFSIYRYAFLGLLRKGHFSYVINLEMDNTLKRVLFNIVSGQIISDTLRK